MHPRQKQIIEASIELFAKKGYHATSVQEIVDEANIAKGSFYNYFESKEDLILSMYDYYHALLTENMNKAIVEDDAKKSLINQLEVYFNFIIEHKSLIIMLLRDQVPLGKNVQQFVIRSKQQNFEWIREQVRNIYGNEIKRNENDAVTLFEGMINSYSNWIVFSEQTVNIKYLPKFLVDQLDVICKNFIKQKNKPIIEQLPNIFNDCALLVNRIRQQIQNHINEDKEKALEAIEVIEQEMQKKVKQSIIVESMLIHLEKYDLIREEIKQLKKLLQT